MNTVNPFSDYEWHRSSFCASGACVDVRREEDVVLVRRTGEDSPTLEFTEDEWADVLIEVRDESSGLVTMLADGVCLTDSHIRHLHVTEDEWNAFVAGVKNGEFEIDKLSSGEAGSGFRGVARSGHAATGAGAIAVPPVPVAAQPPKTGFVHPLLHINYVEQRPGIEPCFDCGRPMDDNYTDPNRCAGCHAKHTAAPVAAHHQTAGWSGGPGECGAVCACGVEFDNFDTIAEAAALLDGHIADETRAAALSEISDELVELVAQVEYAFDGQDVPEDIDIPWNGADPALKNFFVRRAKMALEVAVPLLRKRWENEVEPAWGSGPLVKHVTETTDESDDGPRYTVYQVIDGYFRVRDTVTGLDAASITGPNAERRALARAEELNNEWTGEVEHNPETPAVSRQRGTADRSAVGEADPAPETPGGGSAEPIVQCKARRPERGDGDCEGPLGFAVVYRSSKPPHKVLDSVPACFAHARAEVQRALAANSIALVDVERTS